MFDAGTVVPYDPGSLRKVEKTAKTLLSGTCSEHPLDNIQYL
jgi:hypothetical protein